MDDPFTELDPKLGPGFRSRTRYNVLHSAKNAEHALQFFRWVERSNLFEHNRETHHKIIEILGRASKLIMLGLCDAEKMSEANSILKEMVDKYIAPKDNSIFMRLISGQCKAGNLDAAVDVLKSMNRAIKLLDKLIEKDIILKPQSTLHMEPSAYNPLIEYLCNNGQTAKAETLLRQLMKLGVQDPIALNTLIRGHSEEGTPDSAFELLKIMLRRKVDSEKSAYDSLVQSY
ncbi:hypothetical protein BUALT_Bualt09G0069700 [Buddleja alternifolia]|uniref:Pentatricopeptide repeat-containing protein n=1 Tax=Buddleja alternifolia TaxID=168488 RepID=A0AAV6X1U1_9LAMI|nr:hypothetical protein BUALT_Bualt09G0069700 [Buddleja alternifolia]